MHHSLQMQYVRLAITNAVANPTPMPWNHISLCEARTHRVGGPCLARGVRGPFDSPGERFLALGVRHGDALGIEQV